MSLIHFAAYGDAEREEIALAPPSATEGIPHEPDYLLSMGEVSEFKLTAKLVVLKLLSYCVWANESRSEGVIGISRAFLESGARSVLIALVDHRRQSNRVVHEPFLRKLFVEMAHELLCCFVFLNLVHGESASDDLFTER